MYPSDTIPPTTRIDRRTFAHFGIPVLEAGVIGPGGVGVGGAGEAATVTFTAVAWVVPVASIQFRVPVPLVEAANVTGSTPPCVPPEALQDVGRASGPAQLDSIAPELPTGRLIEIVSPGLAETLIGEPA
jgi:hypothetical protein